MVGKVHLQRHHPLRPRRLRPCGRRSRRLLRSSRTARRRYLAEGQRGGATTRRAAATVPPAPRCLPNATRRGGGLCAHAEACGFGHRSRHRIPISGSIKVRVFTRAKGRCECCGAHEHQKALEVDHILPRNQGGSDDLSNLQALCFRCNAGKRDGCLLTQEGSTDFRGLQASGPVLLENELALCIADAYPVTPGHSLVIPRRHGSRNQIRWAGTVRWSAARPQEPAWPASDHGWPASSARSHR
jgi:5-methylcytosine-specific restriction endonuclease McrA